MPPRGEDLSPDDPAPSCVLPAGLRVRAHRTVWFAAAALAPLAGLVRGRDVPPAWDAVPPWEHLQGSPLLQTVLDVFARALPRAAPLVVLAIAAACWLGGARRAAAFALLAPACACATTVVLKHLLARPSADGTGWMFPSGHVTAVAAVAAVLTVLLLPGGCPRRTDLPRRPRRRQDVGCARRRGDQRRHRPGAAPLPHRRRRRDPDVPDHGPPGRGGHRPAPPSAQPATARLRNHDTVCISP